MLRLVFSDARFSVMAAAVFAVLTFALLFMSEYIFLEPYLVGHVPRDSELGLALIILIAVMSAIAIPANVYRVVMLNSPGRKMGGGIAGSALGTAAGACSCGPVGFAVISTFGAAGATATAFLTEYELPLRIASACILALTLAATHRSFSAECRIRPNA